MSGARLAICLSALAFLAWGVPSASACGRRRGIRQLVPNPARPGATPPTPPANLSATPGDTQIALSWEASSDDVGVAGYRVYRDGVRVARTTGTSYLDTGLTDGSPYSYYVVAYDAAGHVSSHSNTVSATPVSSTDRSTGRPTEPTEPAYRLNRPNRPNRPDRLDRPAPTNQLARPARPARPAPPAPPTTSRRAAATPIRARSPRPGARWAMPLRWRVRGALC